MLPSRLPGGAAGAAFAVDGGFVAVSIAGVLVRLRSGARTDAASTDAAGVLTLDLPRAAGLGFAAAPGGAFAVEVAAAFAVAEGVGAARGVRRCVAFFLSFNL